ncbi:amidase domain-containing protein [Agromyces larvae]|uniref:Amidase domain-containing protein n=1 Tax=Agromyces larvae TaxID=2929802 RepID=A0ABY4C4P5_9MICO|nr:amidase domain-containing protein [Agromyces larvae]UOE45392.1 amidase domain-containing protein [Agromyces larvae]
MGLKATAAARVDRWNRRGRGGALAAALALVAGTLVTGLIATSQHAAASADWHAAAARIADLRDRHDDAEQTLADEARVLAALVADVDAILVVGAADLGLVPGEAESRLVGARDAAARLLVGDNVDAPAVFDAVEADPAELATAALRADAAEFADAIAPTSGRVTTLVERGRAVAASADRLRTAVARFAVAAADRGTAILAERGDADDAAKAHLSRLLDGLAGHRASRLATAVAAYRDAVAAVVAASEEARARAAAEAAAAEAARASAEADARADAEAAARAGRTGAGSGVGAQMAYLFRHVFDYNTAEWGDYNSSGGDCVNFVSQGLLARGWSMDSTWYSNGPGAASRAWISTTALNAYLTSLGIPRLGLDQLDLVKVGDVGVFDWGETGPGFDHAMTVSKVEPGPDGPIVSFVSHNLDGEYRELRYTLYEQHSNSSAWIFSIP